jgi:hypothetical protein
MSKYLIDEIEHTSNIVVEPNTQVLAAEGSDHLERIATRGRQGESTRKAASLVCVYWRGAPDGVAARMQFCGTKRVHSGRAGFDQVPESPGQFGRSEGAQGSLPRCGKRKRAPFCWNQRAGSFCGRRRAARVGQAGGFGGWRRFDRGAVCSPVSGQLLMGGIVELGKL